MEAMVKVWRETYKITWDAAGASGRLGLPQLAGFMQETAWHHAHLLGVGFEANQQDNRAWVLMRMEIWTDNLPGWEQTLTLETWPAGIEGFQALRNFRFFNSQGNEVGGAATSWLIIDAESRRPRRPEAFEYLRKAVVPEFMPHFSAPEKIKLPESNFLRAGYRKVSFSDIDMHGHVNNSRYLTWCLDAFPTTWHLENRITHLNINFLQEALEAEEIEIYRADTEKGKTFLYGLRQSDHKIIFTTLLDYLPINVANAG
ncbi:MAG: acyl-[acyl-carrier-protein] thioesterase [Bacteroidales bacterium]